MVHHEAHYVDGVAGYQHGHEVQRERGVAVANVFCLQAGFQFGDHAGHFGFRGRGFVEVPLAGGGFALAAEGGDACGCEGGEVAADVDEDGVWDCICYLCKR